MARIKIKVGLTALSDSNAFLRALWAEFRRQFGRLAWVYTPYRDGVTKTVSFGEAQLGGKDIVSVLVSYKVRGSIHEIIFTDENPHTHSNLGVGQNVFTKIEDCVQIAIEKFRNPAQFSRDAVLIINSDHAFHAYEGRFCVLRPLGPGRARLRIHVAAFDEVDARNEYLLRAIGICDHLTAWTNIAVTMARKGEIGDQIDVSQLEEPGVKPNIAWAELDWMDGAPFVEKRIAVSSDQFSWIDAYAADAVDHRHPIARANRHFAEALRLSRAGQFPEVSQTLLVSALEAIGEKAHKPEQCPHCGQLIYKISRRVYELAVRRLGSHAARHIKMFYEQRSKFLHSGALPTHYPLIFGSTPQLDASDPSGCVVHRSPSPNINLIEFTSFILRAECASWWASRQS